MVMIPPPKPKERLPRRIHKSVSMTAEIWKGLAAEARKAGVTVSALVEHVCLHYLKGREGSDKDKNTRG